LHLTVLNVVGSLGRADFAHNMAELMANLYLGILSIENERLTKVSSYTVLFYSFVHEESLCSGLSFHILLMRIKLQS
jgi:hypothetical protein